MSRLTRTLTAVPLAAAALMTAPSAAVAARDARPQTIPLQTGSQPEGIAAGPGSTFYAGARRDGAVYVGDVRTGEVDLLVPGDRQGPAVGMLYDPRSGLLWVAGGNGGDVTAYDGTTGAVVYRAETGAGRFLNDVAIAADAVYVTDSRSDRLVVVPLVGARPAGPATELRLTGDFVPAAAGAFGPNGIRVLDDGDLLVVSEGVLYRVDPATGAADEVEVGGRQLTAGDGLVLDGSTLYVVNGYGGDEVAVLRLAPDAGSARAVGVVRSQELDRPTTGAIVDGALYVVNGRFGVAADPATEYSVSRLRTR